MFKEMASEKAYRLLESGPIVMVTTRARDGTPNVMTMGFHMMMQHEPALIGAVLGPWDHSFSALRELGECVIAVPTIDLAQTVVDVGNCSGAQLDKFEKFGLTTMPSRRVDAPSIMECFANLECTVVDQSMVSRYNMFVLEVKRIVVDESRPERRLIHHQGDGRFVADGETLDLRERMVHWRYLMD
ncbi:flavin reductase (DIM6/NTAB) family NADH-FMN oxidoreductase RutF [Caballeronia udeis]|jgi:flavin reductase (DIM6/NTAB) family NADH-FMN oxidoreductase RutF|uniref:Flavin reductase (DIM6/NTAB) family NADH-FMN oxidoreductase RutF n=1 Tax=Caballeronia udeis TaxID=1232866 RepID=A0ABW8MVS5_9BURK